MQGGLKALTLSALMQALSLIPLWLKYSSFTGISYVLDGVTESV